MRTGVFVALAICLAVVAAQQNSIIGTWAFTWQFSGFPAVYDCYPTQVVITAGTSQTQVNVAYTFSSTVASSTKCNANKINATSVSSTATIDSHGDYYYDDNYPFDFQAQTQIGVLGVRVSGDIYFQFSMVPAANPGPNQAAYAAALKGTFSSVIPGTTRNYFWHSKEPTPVNSTSCCIPDSLTVTISPNNASYINATLNFDSTVTANPWCAASNFTSGANNFWGFVEQISTTYNVTAWGADFDSHFGNAYDFIFFYDNSTLRIGYSVNNENAQGACGFDIDTSAVIA